MDRITIEDARIIFRNFSGKPSEYNKTGARTFCVLLDPRIANELADDEWNVKWTRPKNEDDDPIPYLQVTVRYDRYPPKIVAITSKGRTVYSENQVMVLDFADIKKIDMTITSYKWSDERKPNRKAYLKNMFVTLEEDELELKYQDVPYDD